MMPMRKIDVADDRGRAARIAENSVKFRAIGRTLSAQAKPASFGSMVVSQLRTSDAA